VPLLEALGHDVCVPDYRGVLCGPPPYYGKIARHIAHQCGEASALIVHSGAGALAPAVKAVVDDVRGAIFVDALLPHPGRCWFDTAPKAMIAHLHGLEIEGRLPPWNRWWPDGTLEAMLPDARMREAFIADLLWLPSSYFEERAPDISLPEKLSCAYLQLSLGYDAEASEAQSRGWPTQSLVLNHLAMLTHPEEVASALSRVLLAIA
jgi:hypothetical protein